MTTPRPLHSSYDAIVVGARCAGSSTALLLARQGLRVLAVERSRYGSDTLSTLALMRAGVLQLRRWGLLDELRAKATPTVESTSFHYAGETITVEIAPRDGIDGLYAPRRTVLDPLLTDAARDSGVEVLNGVHVKELQRSAGGRVCGVALEHPGWGRATVEAGLVIGADGRNSTVARAVGAETLHSAEHTSGVVYGYFAGLDRPAYEWYYRPGSSAGIIPTNDGLTLVFAATGSARFEAEMRSDIAGGFARVLRECAPALAEEIAGAQQVGRFWGFPGAAGFVRRSYGPGWALVGDASYFKDPITAHGISDALRDAELLARAAARGSDRALAEYQEERDALSLPFFHITDRIATYDWDLDEIKRLHLEANAEMKREVEHLLTLDDERSTSNRDTEHRAA